MLRSRCLDFVVWSCITVASAVKLAASPIDVPLVVTQVPLQASASNAAPANFGECFERARIVLVATNGTTRVLSEGFQSACDPVVAFDSKHMLFSGKKSAQDLWSIWELEFADGSVRQITKERDCRYPCYLSPLFTLDSPKPWYTIAFASDEKMIDERGNPCSSSIYNLSLDGSELRRVTYNPNRNVDPFQMWDNRLLYAGQRSRTEPGGVGVRSSLYSVNVEGTEVELYGGEQGGRFQRMPCATPDGLVVFIETDNSVWDNGGQLACVDQKRPHVTYRPLTSDTNLAFVYPSPFRENQVLVSRRTSAKDGRDSIYLFDAKSGSNQPVFDDPQYHTLQAHAVMPRQQPDGRSTVVNPKVDTGIFYAINCYDTDPQIRTNLDQGTLKRVRIIEGVTSASITAVQNGPKDLLYLSDAKASKGPAVARRILGEAPIEPDGSFNVEVPADTPILIQTLDRNGMALGTCGWVWVKPKEPRGCVGCHEDPELTPENNYVQALRRKSTPVLPPAAERRQVAFKNDVVPILKNRCATAECHGSATTSFQVSLHADQPSEQDLQQAYATLLSPRQGGASLPGPIPQVGRYIDAGRARTSLLVWQLFGRDTSRPWDRARGETNVKALRVKPMPPRHAGGPLAEDEIRTIIEWIDLGAAYESTKVETH